MLMSRSPESKNLIFNKKEYIFVDEPICSPNCLTTMKKFFQILTVVALVACCYGCETPVPDPVKVDSVTLNESSITLNVGESYSLVATVLPTDAENKSVKWESSAASVATVDNNGKVTAITAGSTTITAKTEDGNKTASCTVIVNEQIVVIESTSVTLNKTTLTLTEGESETLIATVNPSNATNKDVTWSSDNSAVATVAEGTVTAVAPGTATITVKTADGKKSDSCVVTVEAALLKDVDNVSDLKATTNIPEDQFFVTWKGVENAVGYKCWYVMEGDDYEMPADAKDNGDGTWSAKSSTAMGASTYTFYVEPLPAEGHGLINDEPSSIEIILHKYDKTGFSYRFMLEEVEEGVEYETACYDLEVKYKNIQFRKSDNTQPIADDWYIYTTTPVEDIHHLQMWYSLNYDEEDEPIEVYSSTTPGVMQTKLTPDGEIMSGKWKVYYRVPEGDKYIYIRGKSKSVYMLWTSFYICHAPADDGSDE